MNPKKNIYNIKIFREVILQSSKINRYKVYLTIFASVITGLLEYLILENLANIFSIINGDYIYQSNLINQFCSENNIDFCSGLANSQFAYIFSFICLIILTFFSRLFCIYSLAITSSKVTTELGKKVFSHIIRMNYSYHLDGSSSRIIGLCVNDIAVASEGIRQFMLFINNVILSIFIVFGIISTGNKAIYFILISITIFFSIFIYITKEKLKLYGYNLTTYRYKLIKSIQSSIGNILNIILSRSHKNHIFEYSEFNYKLRDIEAKMLFIKLIPRISIETGIVLFISIFALIIYLFSDNLLTKDIIPSIGVLAVAIQRLIQYLQQCLLNWSQLLVGSTSAKNLLNILKDNQLLYRKSLYVNKKFNFKSLDCKNIRYLYFLNQGNKKVGINKITLTIKRGEVIGIIGKTGSGKSTLINLLMGLSFPQSGVLRVNGKHIKDFYNDQELINYQNIISYVPQKIFLIDATILDNITLKKEKEVNYELLNNIIQITQLEDVINNLPQGLRSIVGENGMKLSGGQQQRIGIARALYNSNSQILFLDEATSALDSSTEKKIIEKLISNYREKTIIMIAHRHNTLSYCSRILKIENNEISKDGDPKDLLSI